MRWVGLVVGAVLLAACGSSQESLLDRSTTTAPATSTTTAAPSTTPPSTTTAPTSTTTTTNPTTTTTTLAPLQALAYELVGDGFEFPIWAGVAPGDRRVYVAEKIGRVLVVEDAVAEVWLDIRDPVRSSGEQGLLGVAFSPDFASSGRFYVHYTRSDGAGVLAEFIAQPDGSAVDPATERQVLVIPQPARNHNGGMIQFGPDGYLYMGLGDGGRSNDAFGNGQRPDTLLGAILRLDVSHRDLDGDGTDDEPYSIPMDNPFVDGGITGDLEGHPLVWAYGLRNPWRFFIDGDRIVIGDVGQNNYEEIDVAPLEPAGHNFGWPITEALHCFSPRQGCDVEGLVLPQVEIEHGDRGTCSVTGGVVVRDPAIPELEGQVVFSDYCGGYLRSFLPGDAPEVIDWTGQVGGLTQVTSFGVDADGSVLVVSAAGTVHRIVAQR